MTRAERDTNKIKAAPKGSVFGDGIYTANNATGFSAYGDTGEIMSAYFSVVRFTFDAEPEAEPLML